MEKYSFSCHSVYVGQLFLEEVEKASWVKLLPYQGVSGR